MRRNLHVLNSSKVGSAAVGVGISFVLSCSGAPQSSERIVPPSESTSLQDAGIQRVTSLDSLADIFGRRDLLLGFYHDSTILALHTKLGIISNHGSAIEVDADVSSNIDSVYLLIDSAMTVEHEHGMTIVARLSQWCRVKSVLDATPEICSSDFYFEELVYTIPQSKHLFNKYLTSEDQYWGSLSVEDSFDLYYRVIEHFSRAEPKERADFIARYTTLLCAPSSVKNP